MQLEWHLVRRSCPLEPLPSLQQQRGFVRVLYLFADYLHRSLSLQEAYPFHATGFVSGSVGSCPRELVICLPVAVHRQAVQITDAGLSFSDDGGAVQLFVHRQSLGAQKL